MKDRKHCKGCYNENYHYGLGGSKECWMFKDAKVIWRKEVHVDQRPPWNQKAIRRPNCYTKRRYVYVQPHQVR